MNAYIERVEKLSGKAKELHRVLSALAEELQTLDHCQQRMDVSQDGEFKDILDRKAKQAAAQFAELLELARQRHPALDAALKNTRGISGTDTHRRATAA